MAIIGGAGNPVGGSFTGPAEALEIVGNHAYAYSGVINNVGGGSATSTMLSFTTGNYYYQGILNIIDDNITGSVTMFIDITFNGVSVYKGAWDNSPDMASTSPLVTLIIPSYTEVVVKWGCSNDRNGSIAMTGKIYRD